MHILLVEDDIVNQKIAVQLLKNWGFDVTVAEDGNKALCLINQKKFNLILMDLNMPYMDGAETTGKIRNGNDGFYRNIPILAYTASTAADTREKAQQLGMDDFVTKPLNPEELHCKINHYLLMPIVEPRPLKINFELYADSEPEFKRELVELMMSNIQELQSSSYKSYYASDPAFFRSISHKVRSTLILLDDKEFLFATEDLKSAFVDRETNVAIQQKIKRLDLLATAIYKTLNSEVSVLRAAC